MRRSIFVSAWLLIGLTGCQNLGGLGGYSAQSVTRVPPIGTGSFQVPGSYYGNAGAPANAGANATPANRGMTVAADNSATSSNLAGVVNDAAGMPSTSPQVSTAGYLNDQNLSVPTVTTAGETVSSTGNSNLQWQR